MKGDFRWTKSTCWTSEVRGHYGHAGLLLGIGPNAYQSLEVLTIF